MDKSVLTVFMYQNAAQQLWWPDIGMLQGDPISPMSAGDLLLQFEIASN